MPMPNAWKDAPKAMAIAANGKCRLTIRNAVMPIRTSAALSSPELKMPISTSGKI